MSPRKEADKPYCTRQLESGLWELCRVTWTYKGRRLTPLETFLTEQGAELALRGRFLKNVSGAVFNRKEGDYVQVYSLKSVDEGRVRHGHMPE